MSAPAGTDPGNGLVGHIRGKMIIGILGNLDLGNSVIYQRRPLIGFTAQETIEFFKTRSWSATDLGNRKRKSPMAALHDFCQKMQC